MGCRDDDKAPPSSGHRNKRKLGNFEHAWTLTDEFAPATVVGVLQLSGSPSPEILRKAMGVLQERHPFLGVHIIREKSCYYFESEGTPCIPLQVAKRIHDEQWVDVVEHELNHSIDTGIGPLMRCTYIYDPRNSARSEIILTFDHVIVDGNSGVNLFHELLSLCDGLSTHSTVTGYPPLDPCPPSEALFPHSFSGPRRVCRTMAFLLRQIGDEIRYRWLLRGRRKAPINKTASCKILTTKLSENLTTDLVRRSRRERVTMNSVLSTAMLLAVQKHIYGGQTGPFRHMTFAGLRPYLKPPPSDEHLGCYISMCRFTVQVRAGHEFWILAKEITQKIYRSTKRGDKFIAAVMAKELIQILIALKVFRMGTTALSFAGVSKLKPSYGPSRPLGLHAFVSNFVLGPEYTALANVFAGELCWDIVYLDSDMDRLTAQAIAAEMLTILEVAVS